MDNPAALIEHSSLIWLMATGLVLGALHALEPGHAKTLIASFVVATRGTVPQAVLLGLSAALSHSVLIWLLAALAIYFGDAYIGADAGPWLQLGSGVVIVAIGLTMFWRHSRARAARLAPRTVGPQGGKLIDTGHGFAEITVFEQEVAPQFQLFFYDAAMAPRDVPDATTVGIRTVRPDGSIESFAFVQAGLCLSSTKDIPEPHEFAAELSLSHGDHAHTYTVGFSEADHAHDHAHGHGHAHEHDHGHSHDHGQAHEDAHARAHARQIEQHLGGQTVTTRQLVLFGLTSGLMPCPAALTLLLVCLRLKRAVLGAGLVLSFSVGLAVTMVSLGVVAAIGVRQASKHLAGFGRVAEYLPYASGAVVMILGAFMGVSAYVQLA